MTEEASLEFRLRKVDLTGSNLLEEIKHNDLISEKCKKTCKYLNYFENLLILISPVTGYVSASTFTLLVRVPVGITSSAVGLKICKVTAGIQKNKLIIKKKKKKYDKIVLLEKDRLNTIEFLTSKALMNSYISHD